MPRKPRSKYDSLTKAQLIAELHKLESSRRMDDSVRERADRATLWQEQFELQHEQLLETQRSLEQAIEKYVDLYDFAPLAYVSLDGAGIIEEINLTGANLLGVDRKKLSGLPMRSFVSSDDRRIFLEHMRKCRSGNCPTSTELRLRARDGKEIPVTMYSGTERAGNRRSVFRTALIDTTERVRADDAVRRGREQLQIVADAAPVFIALYDVDGVLQFANRSYATRLGKTPEQLVGKSLAEILGEPAYEAIAPHFVRASRGELVDFEVEAPLSYGNRWMHAIYVPQLDNSGIVNAVVAVVQDITERRRSEEALRHAKEQADAANRAKDNFLAMLSHELRTPLTPVLAAAISLETVKGVPEEVRADLQLIRRNIELEARLIDDLLDLTRVSRGKLTMQMAPADLHKKIKSVIEICRNELELRQQKLHVDLAAKSHFVKGDAARLQQVLWNIVKNAIKFSPHHAEISVRTYNSDGKVTVEIADRGIGIDPQILPRLFNAFEQGTREVTKAFGGLGLGLAISKALVDLHGGTIRAESDGHNRGSKFTIELPLCETVAEPVQAEPAPQNSQHGRGARILLVEDHPDTSKIMGRLLRRHGYHVSAADSVATAIRAAMADKPDLIVSDIGLPDGTGHDLIRQLRGIFGAIRGIALSGFGMDEDIRRSKEAGFAEHVTKPVNLHQLLALIEQALRHPVVSEGTTATVPMGK